MQITETNRLKIRQLNKEDAAFIFELVNQPPWLTHIGDKSVHSLIDAENYIISGPVSMYEEYGFGLYLVELLSNEKAIGICGLIKRDYLPEPDIGFAFLSEYWHKGYAHESAAAIISDAIDRQEIKNILAITTLHNHPSIKLLDKLGFVFDKTIEDNDKVLNLYLYSLACQTKL